MKEVWREGKSEERKEGEEGGWREGKRKVGKEGKREGREEEREHFR